MQPLLHPIDIVPLIMMGLGAVLLLASIIRLWPDLMRERAADAAEERLVAAQAAEAERQGGHGHLH